jgi:predicted RNase H-like HicB family nuclease
MKISLRVEIFKEDDSYVALSPELNVSSFGETIEDAKRSSREALEAFLEECLRMGTLEDVLEDSGFSKVNRYLRRYNMKLKNIFSNPPVSPFRKVGNYTPLHPSREGKERFWTLQNDGGQASPMRISARSARLDSERRYDRDDNNEN